jgi:hypothetical protein
VGAEGVFPDLDRWNPWRPKKPASRLQALEVPWAVAAGWAIDLFVGRESRAHDDLEIVVARPSFGAVRAVLPELTWFGDEVWEANLGVSGRSMTPPPSFTRRGGAIP